MVFITVTYDRKLTKRMLKGYIKTLTYIFQGDIHNIHYFVLCIKLVSTNQTKLVGMNLHSYLFIKCSGWVQNWQGFGSFFVTPQLSLKCCVQTKAINSFRSDYRNFLQMTMIGESQTEILTMINSSILLIQHHNHICRKKAVDLPRKILASP